VEFVELILASGGVMEKREACGASQGARFSSDWFIH
jgi:hypothetical protein